MALLRALTLIYVAILVLALAVSLILILIRLMRIGQALAETKSALAAVETGSRGLKGLIEPIKDEAGNAAGLVAQARDNFEGAGKHLNTVAERFGITQRTG